MSIKYPHLLSPFKIGNHVFKNRMVATASCPAHEMGNERYPNDALFTNYVNKAKSGAGLVIIQQPGFYEFKPLETPEDRAKTIKFRKEKPNPFNPEFGWDPSGIARFPSFDLIDGGAQHYLSTMVEAIHFYDAKCFMKSELRLPPDYDISPGNAPQHTEGAIHVRTYGKIMTEKMLMEMIERAAFQAILLKEVGMDGIYVHMAYRGSAMARFLSPITNKREDKYGGSIENRARFAIMLADGIKKRCGQDFLVHASLSGYEEEGGYTVDDAVEFAKLFTGHFDTLEIRGTNGDDTQPPNFNHKVTPFLEAAEKIKKGAPDIGIIAVGGFQDLDISEDAIASGKADFIGSARAWICNLDYGQLAYEGRNEDVVPCLRCNGCHLMSYYKPWNSYCAVNPVWGLEHKIDSMISPPQRKKKVAVIGGGPAGMEAALIASEGGHDVTLFEKNNHLGGNLKLIENVSFKWPHKDFNNYLERQIEKSGVNVRLNTEGTPEMIQKDGYDAVIAAIGADAIVPDIPGSKGENVILAPEIYGNEDNLAKEVVIIGGGETGVEAGMHLAETGRNVTVLEMSHKLARRSVPIHYYSMFREAWEKLPNFKWILNAHCNGISRNGVTYIDADGKEQSMNAGSVVIAAGIKSRTDAALKFYNSCDRFYMIGDCKAAEGIQGAVRSAFSTAKRL